MVIELESFDKPFSLQVLEENENGFTSVTFLVAAGTFKAALLEDIGESDDGYHLLGMSDNFENATQDIGFDGDIHASILLVGHVEQSGITRQHLPTLNVCGDFPNGRFAVERNDGGFFAVDGGLCDAFRRKNGGDNLVSIAAVVLEVLARIGHVNGDLSAHELIDSG